MYSDSVEQILMFVAFGYLIGAGIFGFMCVIALLRFRAGETSAKRVVKGALLLAQLLLFVLALVHIGKELNRLPANWISDLSVYAFMAAVGSMTVAGVW